MKNRPWEWKATSHPWPNPDPWKLSSNKWLEVLVVKSAQEKEGMRPRGKKKQQLEPEDHHPKIIFQTSHF